MIPSREEFFNLPPIFDTQSSLDYCNSLSIGKKGFSGTFSKDLKNDENIDISLNNEKHQFSEVILFYDLNIKNNINLSISLDSKYYGDVFIGFRMNIEQDLQLNFNFNHERMANIYLYLLFESSANTTITKNINVKLQDFPNIRFYCMDYMIDDSYVKQKVSIELNRGHGSMELIPRALILEECSYESKTLYYYRTRTNILLKFKPETIKVCEKGKIDLSFNNARS